MASNRIYQSITLYKDMCPQVLELTEQEAGKIYQAIFRFSCYGQDTDFSENDRFVRSLWETTKLKLQTGEAYDKQISETNRANIKKRWEKEKGNTTVYDGNTTDTTVYDGNTITNTVTGTNTHTISSTVTNTETEEATAAFVDRSAASAAAKAEPPAGDLFSIKQLMAIVSKNKVDLTKEGVQEFYNQMQDDGWTLYNKPVEKKTILRTLREYSKRHPEYAKDIEPDAAPNQEPESTETQNPDIPVVTDEMYEQWLVDMGYK